MKRLFCLAVILAAGCSPAKPADKAVHDKAPAEDAYREIPEQAVSFVRMHPGAAQHNSYLDWRLFRNVSTGDSEWRVDGKAVSAEAAAALETLIASVTKNLVPSDGIYTCRYRQSMPQYRLKFKRGGREYSVVSASDCLHGAPFNVIVDGAYQVQFGGEIGAALENALMASGLDLKIGGSPAMMMIGRPMALDGFEAKALRSPLEHYDELFRADAVFAQRLGAVEDVFGRLQPPAVACNQAKSPDCRDVSARYTLNLGRDVYQIALKYDSGSVRVSSEMAEKEGLEALKKAAASPVYSVYSGLDSQFGAALKYDAQADCTMIRGLAKHMDSPAMASCAAWRLSGGNRPPAVYYEGLDAFWIAGENAELFYKALCAQDNISKTAKQKLCAKGSASAGRNVFIKSDGRAYVFETKDGKTTLL